MVYDKGIAYLGPQGSFSHEASILYAKKHASKTPAHENTLSLNAKDTLASVFQSVKNGDNAFGVAAIENNVEGFVGETLDLLLEHNDDLQIIDMLWLPVQFDAVYASTPKLDAPFTPKVLKAHPHALAQCRNFISKRSLSTQPALSNSAAVLGLGDDEIALAPHESNAFRNVKVYESLVQDYQDAKTQFVLIAKRTTANALKIIEDHNIWAITPENDTPGTLAKILQVINRYGINISTLISRPVKATDARYTFFMTLDASYEETEKCMYEISELENATFHLGYYHAEKMVAETERI
ncbi:MAG: ACT domain-containing protein [Candidatus Ancillula sp.]|jgi:prephenate dehydratase|nr:ACT domain-containing protein [Candidatus Ancillula sp.]